jgi:hypothetical protein
MFRAVRCHALIVLVCALSTVAPAVGQVSTSQSGSLPSAGVSNSNTGPMPSFETRQGNSDVPSRGETFGKQPSALQCANLLRRAASVPGLKQSPDYAYCDAARK